MACRCDHGPWHCWAPGYGCRNGPASPVGEEKAAIKAELEELKVRRAGHAMPPPHSTRRGRSWTGATAWCSCTLSARSRRRGCRDATWPGGRAPFGGSATDLRLILGRARAAPTGPLHRATPRRHRVELPGRARLLIPRIRPSTTALRHRLPRLQRGAVRPPPGLPRRGAPRTMRAHRDPRHHRELVPGARGQARRLGVTVAGRLVQRRQADGGAGRPA